MKKFLTVMTAVFLSFFAVATAGELMGAGATFPQPLYAKMFDSYNRDFGIKVNYQGIGSGGGIKQITAKIIDFGGTDAFMTNLELAAAGAKIVHIPTCLGAVALTYNLPGNPQLKLTAELVSEIFNGKITKWNDPKIVSLNTGVALPNSDIYIAHRSDGSGTTAIFTDYLSKIDPKNWTIDKNFKTQAKLALGGKGNAGVAGLVKSLPGAIGYVEMAYAKQNKMAMAQVQNKSGNFILPTLEATSLAADVEIPADTRVSITNTAAAHGYPICGFTWLVAYQEQNYNGRKIEKAQDLVKLLTWMVTDGQTYTQDLDYGALPKSVAAKALTNIGLLTFDGQPLK